MRTCFRVLLTAGKDSIEDEWGLVKAFGATVVARSVECQSKDTPMPTHRALERGASPVRPERRPVVPPTAVSRYPLRLKPDPAPGHTLPALDAPLRSPPRTARRRRRALMARLELYTTPTKDYLVLRLRGDVSMATVTDARRCETALPFIETSWVLASGASGALGRVAFTAACQALDRFLGRW